MASAYYRRIITIYVDPVTDPVEYPGYDKAGFVYAEAGLTTDEDGITVNGRTSLAPLCKTAGLHRLFRKSL